jgi:FkbM family methyltransferase
MKKIKYILRKVLGLKKSNEEIQAERCVRWFADNGDNTLRLNYNLDKKSIVFDVGGYYGDFAQEIFRMYSAQIFIFEPVNDFYYHIVHRFKSDENIRVFNFGLGAESETSEISLLDDRSSFYADDGLSKSVVNIKSIVDFVTSEKIQYIDLIKLNIEGAEYALLESLITNGMITKFGNIQVQFHDFVIENAKYRMDNIRKSLSLTHKQTWCYEFVWENWELK